MRQFHENILKCLNIYEVTCLLTVDLVGGRCHQLGPVCSHPEESPDQGLPVLQAQVGGSCNLMHRRAPLFRSCLAQGGGGPRCRHTLSPLGSPIREGSTLQEAVMALLEQPSQHQSLINLKLVCLHLKVHILIASHFCSS